MSLLDIGEVSGATGLKPSALRFYEEHGLIRSSGRNGLRRQYEPEVLERLAVVIVCQEAGFSLAEITELLATHGEPAWKDLVRRKLGDTRRQAALLSEIADGLEHALDCPSPNVLQCEHFQGVLAATLHSHRHEPSSKQRVLAAREGSKKKGTQNRTEIPFQRRPAPST